MIPLHEHHPGAADRRKRLQPALSDLAGAAILAYDALRPNAKHVDEVDEDFPVRWEAVELGGRTVGRYVRVSFGNHHRLDIYRNHTQTNILSYSWQFTRTHVIGELKTESTRVTKFPGSPADGEEGYIDIQVNTHVYPAVIGEDMRQDDHTCTPSDNYLGAEGYIAPFQTDIERAAREFGS